MKMRNLMHCVFLFLGNYISAPTNAFENEKMARIEGLNSKHLVAGSSVPVPLPHGQVRLYGMRFCPYTERAEVVLARKRVPFELVYINLQRKPDWYWKINPSGKVPTLEYNGIYVNDSLIIAERVNDWFPSGVNYLPNDPNERARLRTLTEKLQSLLAPSLSAYTHNCQDPATIQNLDNALQLLEGRLQRGYFAGAQPGYCDWMIWPWVERLNALKFFCQGTFDVKRRYLKLAYYMDRMMTFPEVTTFMFDGATHARYTNSVLSGRPNYDNP